MVSRRSLAAVAGGIGSLLTRLGLTVMAGWLLHRPWAVKPGSAQPEIVFSTGLHWALLGVGLTALAVGTRRPSARWPDRIARVVGSVTTALCVMRLLEVITGWAVALDFAGVHV